MDKPNRKSLRSEIWFNDMTEPGETAVYLERFTNYGITRKEIAVRTSRHRHRADRRRSYALQSHPYDAGRAREGRHPRLPAASPFEFPVHPMQESCRRPTAALDRNLAYLGIWWKCSAAIRSTAWC